MKCPHASLLKAVAIKNKLASKDAEDGKECSVKPCQIKTNEYLLCLVCFRVLCKSHSIHFNEEGHNIGIHLQQMEFYCFSCDDVVAPSKKNTQLLTEIMVYVKRWFNEADLPVLERAVQRMRGDNLKIPGLANLGNTCFFNSVMQCLFYTRPLAKEILGKTTVNAGIYRVTPGYLTDAFAALITLIHSSTSTVTPKDLFSRISSKFKIYRGFQQQDSHELLRLLLDEIREESKLIENEHRSKSFIDSIFKGRLVSSIVCSECGYVSFSLKLQISCSFEEFFDLSLPIVKASTTPTRNRPILGFRSKQIGLFDGSKSDSELLKQRKILTDSFTSTEKQLGRKSKKSISKSGTNTPNSEHGSFSSLINSSESDKRNRWISSILKGLSTEIDQLAEIDTENCIRNFMRVEVLEGDDAWACGKCCKTANPQLEVLEYELEKGSRAKNSARIIVPKNCSSTNSLPEIPAKPLNLESSPSSDYVKPPPFECPDISSPLLSKVTLEFRSPSVPVPSSQKRLPSSDKESRSKSYSSSSSKTSFEDSEESDVLGSLMEDLDLENLGAPEVNSTIFSKLYRSANAISAETARSLPEDEKSPPIFRRAFKRYLIHNPPEILVLNFKRFQQTSGIFRKVRKVEEHVKFAQYLDLTSYLVETSVVSEILRYYEGPDAQVPNACKYKLYGVVVHSGNLLGGHYVSYVNIANNDWVYFSDSHVRQSSWDEVSRAQAYMLFYQKN